MQPFSLEKPVAHSMASKFSAVLIGRIVSRYLFNSVVLTLEQRDQAIVMLSTAANVPGMWKAHQLNEKVCSIADTVEERIQFGFARKTLNASLKFMKLCRESSSLFAIYFLHYVICHVHCIIIICARVAGAVFSNWKLLWPTNRQDWDACDHPTHTSAIAGLVAYCLIINHTLSAGAAFSNELECRSSAGAVFNNTSIARNFCLRGGVQTHHITLIMHHILLLKQ